MAHYNATNESKFTCSHDDLYLPVHGGLEGIIKDKNVIMRFQNLNGKPVGFHEAFNYLYHQYQWNKSPHHTYSTMEKHLFHNTKTAVYHKTMAVPFSPWNWLGSTESFMTSILHPTDTDAIIHKKNQNTHFFYVALDTVIKSSNPEDNHGDS
jgi:hypothetical protein